jgi:hypothetical protein
MANDHRRISEELVQGVLIDDPTFLKEIVERVLQELLEAEDDRAHRRCSPRTHQRPQRPSQWIQAQDAWYQGRHSEPTRTPGPAEHLLHQALCPLPEKREGARFGTYGDVGGGSVNKEAQRRNRGAMRHLLLKEPRFTAGSLDSELSAWRTRRLEAKAYPYLFVDARYEKVRVDGRVVSQGVLIVSGVREDGFRENLAVEVADTESEATYQELFRSLKRRGLSGVQVVVSDDHEGLKAAVGRHFQGTLPTKGARCTTRGTSSGW